MSDIQLDFRDSAGYVADGAGRTYVLGAGTGNDPYPVTRGGFTFGYVDGTALSVNSRDRDNTLDPRLAGIHFVVSPAALHFEIDLPSSGIWALHMAAGDPSGARSVSVKVYDGSIAAPNLLASIIPTSATAGGDAFDAAGVLYSDAAWPGSETGISLNFTTSTAIFVIGSGVSDGGVYVLQHLRLVQGAGIIRVGSMLALWQ